MGWAVGYDSNWERDIGYGVPAICDHPDCNAEIDRGLGYVCGDDVYGGDRGCGLFFCQKHSLSPMSPKLPGRLCERCYPRQRKPFEAKPDTVEWMRWKLRDESWAQWRTDNPTKCYVPGAWDKGPSNYVGLAHIPGAGEIHEKVKALADKLEEQTTARHHAMNQLKDAFAAISTTNKAKEIFPQFVKYIPEDMKPEANLPMITTVVSDLEAPGWPSTGKKSTK